METSTKNMLLIVTGVVVVGLGIWWWKTRQKMIPAAATGAAPAAATAQSSSPSYNHVMAWVGLLPDPYKTTWINQVIPNLSPADLDTMSGLTDTIHSGAAWTAAQTDLFGALEAKYGKLTPGY